MAADITTAVRVGLGAERAQTKAATELLRAWGAAIDATQVRRLAARIGFGRTPAGAARAELIYAIRRGFVPFLIGLDGVED